MENFKAYQNDSHDYFYGKFSDYFKNASNPSSDKYIHYLKEYTHGEDGPIQLVDSDFLQLQIYLRQAENDLSAEPRPFEDIQRGVCVEYLNSIGNSEENLKQYLSEQLIKTPGLLSSIFANIKSDISKEEVITTLVRRAQDRFVEEMNGTSCDGNMPVKVEMTENKASNPYAAFQFNFKELVGSPYESTIKEWCTKPQNNLVDVLRLKGAWHEMIHLRGTPDEHKTEAFAYLKLLQTFK